MQHSCKLCNSKSNPTKHLSTTKHINNVKKAQTKFNRYTMGEYREHKGFYCELCNFYTFSIKEIEDHTFHPQHALEMELFDQKQVEAYIESLYDEGFIEFDVHQDQYGCLYGNIVY